jgi:hypothetical protein
MQFPPPLARILTRMGQEWQRPENSHSAARSYG